MNDPAGEAALEPKPSDASTEQTEAAEPAVGRSRREAASGRADGEASRQRLLSAALKLFAQRGFDGVSTREIARAARVNLAAITYHFGGKKGLYHAVVGRLIESIGQDFGPAVITLEREVAAAAGDRHRLAAIACAFVRNLLHTVLGHDSLRWAMALMLREFQHPSDAFPVLFEQRIEPMHNAVATLVAAATGGTTEDAEVRLRTVTVITQCMAFGAGRSVVWARLGWDRYTPERIEQVVGVVTANVLAALALPGPVPPEGAS